MFHSLSSERRRVLTSAAIAVGALVGSLPFQAHAGIKSLSITKVTTPFDAAPVIRMKDSGSGYVLDEVVGANIKVRLKADTTGGANIKIESATAKIGNRTFWALAAGYRPKSIDETVQAFVSAPDLAPNTAEAARRCNDHAKQGSAVELGFAYTARFSASVLLDDDGVMSDTTTYIGQIVCAPRKPAADALADQDRPFKVTGISLALAPSAAAKHKPNAGLVCKDGDLTVRVATSKAGQLSFRLHTKVGNAPVDSKPVLTWAKHVGPGKFEAVYKTSIKVAKNSEVQAMAEDLVNPIGLSTGWKLAKVFCSSTGGGDLADKPSTSNPDGIPKLPKPPKRQIEGGADKLTGASRPTHAPTRPARPAADARPVREPAKATFIAPTSRDRRG